MIEDLALIIWLLIFCAVLFSPILLAFGILYFEIIVSIVYRCCKRLSLRFAPATKNVLPNKTCLLHQNSWKTWLVIPSLSSWILVWIIVVFWIASTVIWTLLWNKPRNTLMVNWKRSTETLSSEETTFSTSPVKREEHEFWNLLTPCRHCGYPCVFCLLLRDLACMGTLYQ